jgi:transcriptional accessory protein Tex/SPT6
LDVFAKNLKQVLLMPPLKGSVVLGMDPGFTNGCKLAVVSSSGEVLDTGVIYPPLNSKEILVSHPDSFLYNNSFLYF